MIEDDDSYDDDDLVEDGIDDEHDEQPLYPADDWLMDQVFGDIATDAHGNDDEDEDEE